MNALRNLMQAVGARCLGGRLPNTYLVVDVETSGLSGSINPNGMPACVAQFGIAVVRGKKICSREAHLIRRPPGTMQKRATEVNHITDELLATKGEAPEELYPRLVSLLRVFRQDRCSFIGHNLVKFDAPFINEDIARYASDFKLKPAELIDTGLIYKASKVGVEPRDDETLGDFFHRVAAIRSHARWSLVLTMSELRLKDKFKIDMAGSHDAAFDCYITHLLFEELRQLAEGAPYGF